MKKIIYILSLAFIVFSLTGCVSCDDCDGTIIADAGISEETMLFTTITLDGSNSKVNDRNSEVASYNWYFISKPEGSSSTLLNHTTVNPSFIPDKIGNYLVELTIANSDGITSTDKVNIGVISPLLTPNAGPDQIKEIRDIIQLDGTKTILEKVNGKASLAS